MTRSPHGYLLHNEVTHARLLPVDSAHAFTYPTIAFLVSLDELERRQLDLGRGWVFGYGGRWGEAYGVAGNTVSHAWLRIHQAKTGRCPRWERISR